MGSARQEQLRPWCLWRNVREKAVTGCCKALSLALNRAQLTQHCCALTLSSVTSYWWLKKIIDMDPTFTDLLQPACMSQIRGFRGQHQVPETHGRVDRRPCPAAFHRPPATLAGPDRELGRLIRELQKQRKHKLVRQLEELTNLNPRPVKPCCSMPLLSVVQYLDAAHTLFDLVVFDEASQIPSLGCSGRHCARQAIGRCWGP